MKLQEKASSAKTHFIISFIKSIIRLIGWRIVLWSYPFSFFIDWWRGAIRNSGGNILNKKRYARNN